MTRRIAAAVQAAEATSGLEIVVRVVPRSGSYRDLWLLAAAGVALVALVALVYLPMPFSDVWLVPEVVLAGGLGGWLASRPWVLRRLASARRRAAQVLGAARECFVARAVSGTRDRTGVLVFVSVLEDAVEVVADLGAQGAAPQARWGQLRKAAAGPGDLVDRLMGALAGLKELGACHVPRADDDTNELPDEPEIG